MIIETLNSKLDHIKQPDFDKRAPPVLALTLDTPTEYGNFVNYKTMNERQPSPSLGLHVTIDSDQFNQQNFGLGRETSMNVIGLSDFQNTAHEDKIPHSNYLKKEVSTTGGTTSPMLHQSILAAAAIRKNMLKPKRTL
jgi:hypothetical protein